MSEFQYCFGYKDEPQFEIVLCFSDASNDELFLGAKSLLETTDCMDPKFYTYYYPSFSLNQNSDEVTFLTSFSFKEWEIIAGKFMKKNHRCSQILLRNIGDNDYTIVYDLQSRSLVTVTTNGYNIAINGTRYNEQEIDTLRSDNSNLCKYGSLSDTEYSPDKEANGFDYGKSKNPETISVILNGNTNNKFDSLIVRNVKKLLEDIDSLAISDKTMYFPFSASSEFDETSLNEFDFSNWFLLAVKVTNDRERRVLNALITNKNNNSLCLVVSLYFKDVVAIITNGVALTYGGTQLLETSLIQNVPLFEKQGGTKETESKVVSPTIETDAIASTPTQNKVETTIDETANKVTEKQPSQIQPEGQINKSTLEAPKNTPIKEEIVNEPELTFQTITPVRRIYCTKRYLRAIKHAIGTYGSNLTTRLSKIYQFMISSSDDDLEKWLKNRNTKKFHSDIDDYSISKFVVSFTSPYTAHRIFYTRAKNCGDCGRGLDASSIILLYYSVTSEHDEQGKIASDLAKKINNEEMTELGIGESGKDDIDLSKNFTINQELYEVPFRKNSDRNEPSFNQYGIVSIEQSTILKNNSAPCIFSGSAGTGKTLMSVDLFKRFKISNPEKSIIYITYQPALRDQIQRTFDELGINGEAFTFVSIAEQLLDFNGNSNALKESHFYNWLNTYIKTGEKKNNVLKISSSLEKASSIAYIFYRGIIAGSKKNIDRNTKPMLSKAEFLDEVNDEQGLSIDEKKAIYEVDKDYENHIEKHDEITDNGLALSLLASPKRCYDAIIVDEAQDLTEIQLYAILSLLKEGSTDIFLFGDDNQAINPSLFTLERARSCLMETYGQGVQVPFVSLHDAYRSSSFLVQYINSFNKIKRDCIGHYGYNNDQDEHSVRDEDEGLIPGLLTSASLIDSLINSPIAFKNDTIVITPSEEVKEEAIKRYPNVNPRFFITISEAKGREWDNTILYRFFSSQSDLWERMLDEEKIGKKSTIHRMLFNRFYVALTRAKNGILICEDSPSPLTKKRLLRSIKIVSTPEEYENYFSGSIDDEDWYKYALSKFNDRQYDDALSCLSRISNIDSNLKYTQLKEDSENLSIFKEEVTHGNWSYGTKELDDVIDTLLRKDDKEYLKKAYVMKGEPKVASLLSIDEKATPVQIKNELHTLISLKDKLSINEITYFYTLYEGHLETLINGYCHKLNIPPKEESNNG